MKTYINPSQTQTCNYKAFLTVTLMLMLFYALASIGRFAQESTTNTNNSITIQRYETPWTNDSTAWRKW